MAASFLLACCWAWALTICSSRPPAFLAQPGGQHGRVGAARPARGNRGGRAAPQNIVPYQYATLPVPEAAAGDSPLIELPVSPRSEIDKGWLSSVPFAVPESVVQSLQQRGHEVRQERHVIPYMTEDGRPVVFPVDEVQLQYVGNHDYQ